jgi:hypothetical protein
VKQMMFYYRLPDGSVTQRTVVVDGVVVDPQPPPGAVAITKAQYDSLVAALEQGTAQFVAELQQAEQARAAEDFDALTAAGIPPATAARLAGYVGGEQIAEGRS